MPLLSTYTYAGAASLTGGGGAGAAANCIAHGLPTTPDWAVSVPVGPLIGPAPLSIPLVLATRTPIFVGVMNDNGTGVNAEMVAQFVHSMIR